MRLTSAWYNSRFSRTVSPAEMAGEGIELLRTDASRALAERERDEGRALRRCGDRYPVRLGYGNVKESEISNSVLEPTCNLEFEPASQELEPSPSLPCASLGRAPPPLKVSVLLAASDSSVQRGLDSADTPAA